MPFREPRPNVCERFLGSVRRECPDHMPIMTERELYRVIREYVEFFNAARPHQGIQRTISNRMGSRVGEKREGEFIAFPVPNGLHYDYRKAA
jgi:putative transposase